MAEGCYNGMNKRNFQKELDKIIETNERAGVVPSLLLHSCCAPCSSYCIEYLSRYFKITVFYYNPNISEAQEYRKRADEQVRLIVSMPVPNSVSFVEGDYCPEDFFAMAKGLESCPEGGGRCFRCYEMRLNAAALKAKELGMDYFATTLSISPRKNAEKINEIGERLAGELGVSYLVSDFKKREGYKRSIELSKEYGLYRQDFCGCAFSKAERLRGETGREKTDIASI